MPAAKIQWRIDLSPLMGRRVAVETREGFIREGTLTGVNWLNEKDPMVIDGMVIPVPGEVVINGETADPIPFVQIRRLDRARAAQGRGMTEDEWAQAAPPAAPDLDDGAPVEVGEETEQTEETPAAPPAPEDTPSDAPAA